MGLYHWSEDNSAEIERGWIHRGATVGEAARVAGLADPPAAETTVARYTTGADEFGRPADTLVPLLKPRFYCVPYIQAGPTPPAVLGATSVPVLHVHGGVVPGL